MELLWRGIGGAWGTHAGNAYSAPPRGHPRKAGPRARPVTKMRAVKPRDTDVGSMLYASGRAEDASVLLMAARRVAGAV